MLWLLVDGPKHAYGMQRLIEQQAKHRVVNVRSRASLYQAIERLRKLGLVEVAGTSRRERYPERIVYGITEAGRETAREWLREMLRATGGEYPEFLAAVSVLFGLAPDDAREQLEARAEALSAALEETRAELAGAPAELPRLFLLEEEYRRTMLEAELGWLRSVIQELRAGRLTWSEEWLRGIAASFQSPDEPPR